jgi:hypothetical protein
MKLENGRITVLINTDFTVIQIEDANASVEFCRIRLTPEQLSTALGRTAMTRCEIEVSSLEKVGKKHENKDFTFEVTKELSSSDKRDELRSIAVQALKKEGLSEWQPDNYFSSQSSFFQQDGKFYARCIIRRWI